MIMSTMYFEYISIIYYTILYLYVHHASCVCRIVIQSSSFRPCPSSWLAMDLRVPPRVRVASSSRHDVTTTAPAATRTACISGPLMLYNTSNLSYIYIYTLFPGFSLILQSTHWPILKTFIQRDYYVIIFARIIMSFIIRASTRAAAVRRIATPLQTRCLSVSSPQFLKETAGGPSLSPSPTLPISSSSTLPAPPQPALQNRSPI